MSGAMDWHAWLSAARLDPAVVHEYAVVLARNELEAGDAAYFDHDFLRSMGIDVAKHRLEILKLARPGLSHGERGRRLSSSSAASLSGLVAAAVGRAARYVRALVRLRGEGSSSTALVLVPSQQQPDGHVDVGRSSFGGSCKAPPKRTRSRPKAPAAAGGCRGAATVHAMREVESGGDDETVKWERLFQNLNPN